jgi:predicted nucleotidyltransferase
MVPVVYNMEMKLTTYPQINSFLRVFLSELRTVLGNQLVGMHLYGSLASGDFNPQRSDIDFLVVTCNEMTSLLVNQLEAFHAQLAESQSPWAGMIEGAYLPIDALRRFIANDLPRPMIHKNHFYLSEQGNDWVIHRYILKTREAIVFGPSISNRIDPISPNELRLAVQHIIEEWWEPIIKNPIKLLDADYSSYAILTMCRALYTIDKGDIISKPAAAAWAIDTQEARWNDLIMEALAWSWGDPALEYNVVVEFVENAITRIKEQKEGNEGV